MSWVFVGGGAGAIALIVWTAVAYPAVSLALVVASVVQAGACFWSSRVLIGPRASAIFLGLGAALGWFAEEMGSTRGWFFGSYTYTQVLGPQLGSVPLVIPMMWFGICHIGLVIASFALWRRPAPPPGGWRTPLLAAFAAAMVVTAFDLGADPYFVYVLKAWIMARTDGDWFGETVKGFEGWMIVSFTIVTLFLAIARPVAAAPSPTATASPDAADARVRRAALVPLLIYVCMMVFQICFTQPAALRVVAFYAMGLPVLIALVAWTQWKRGPEGAP